MTYRSSVGLRNRHRNKIPVVVFFIIVAIVVFIFRADISYHLSQLRFKVYSYIRTDASTQVLRDGYIKSLEEENIRLRSTIEAISTEDFNNFVTYPVISTPPFSPYDTLVVAINSQSIPTKDSYVKNVEGFFIGTVESVEKNTAIVRLFSSSGFKNQVRIGSGSSTTLATIEGMGGGNFSAKLPQNTKVNVGDPVNWLGKRNVYLGSVEYLEKDTGSAFNHIYFKLPVDISKIIYVSIEKSSN